MNCYPFKLQTPVTLIIYYRLKILTVGAAYMSIVNILNNMAQLSKDESKGVGKMTNDVEPDQTVPAAYYMYLGLTYLDGKISRQAII